MIKTIKKVIKNKSEGLHNYVEISGAISDVKFLKIKKGKDKGQYIGRFTLTDDTSSLFVTVFPEHWQEVDGISRLKSFLENQKQNIIVEGPLVESFLGSSKIISMNLYSWQPNFESLKQVDLTNTKLN